MCHPRCGFIAILLMIAGPTLSEAADPYWHKDLATARAEAERLNRPILCHFGATWCAPCQKMERSVLNQPQVLDQLKASVIGLKVDVDDHPELARRFGVDRFPTDIFLEPNGQRLLESTGYRNPQEYAALVSRAGTRYADLVASRQPKPPASVTSNPDKPREMVSDEGTAPALQLKGYCPVTLWKHRRWEKGSPQFAVIHKGQLYHLESAQAREEFDQNPLRYAPQFLGCDPVIVWETDRAVPGSIQWAAFYDDHLYLFSTEQNRHEFRQSPDKFVTARVVLSVDQIEATAIR